MKESALILFVRKPELGRVKTRLAATIGDVKALNVYESLLAHTKEVVAPLSLRKFVYYTDIVEQDLWSAEGFYKKQQEKGDLGEKMKAAFDELLSVYKNVIVIGSDCFQISTEIIEEAFNELEKHDFVIGPANDGGYYLLGMKSLHSFVFDEMTWSVSTVFSETIKRIKKNDCSYHLLQELIDVDTYEDLVASNVSFVNRDKS